jgi:hypothetical protein
MELMSAIGTLLGALLWGYALLVATLLLVGNLSGNRE